jgi:transposase
MSEYKEATPNSENPQVPSHHDWRPGDICAQQVDYLPIFKAIADELDLVGLVDQLVSSEMHVSCGLIVLGLVLDTLSGRSPLYRLVEFFEGRDTEILLGESVPAAVFDDHTVGRVLEKLFETGSQMIYCELAMRALALFNVGTKRLHFDTTSNSVCGDYIYDEQMPPPFKIVHGHSKDHRPDLKQFVVSLLCAEGKVPLWGKLEDGNASDKTLNNELLSKVAGRIVEQGMAEEAFIYIADSAMVTEANLEAAANQPFITRLPATYAQCQRVIKKAVAADRWHDVGQIATTKPTKNRPAVLYRISESKVELYGKSYRVVVVHSSSHDRRRQKKIERQLKEEKQALSKSFKEKCLKVYACLADAQAAASAWSAQPVCYHDPSYKIEERPVYRRGRPKKGQPREVVRTEYRISMHVDENAEAVAQMRKEAGCFVLLTNVDSKGEGALTGEEILRIYKEQNGIERNFAFLKDPVIVNSIFLDKEERIEALGLILLISLLFWRLIELRLRRHVESTGDKLTGWDNKPTDRPTTFMMTTKFNNIIILSIGSKHRLSRPLSPVQRQWLRALGMHPGIFTAEPRAG